MAGGYAHECDDAAVAHLYTPDSLAAADDDGELSGTLREALLRFTSVGGDPLREELLGDRERDGSASAVGELVAVRALVQLLKQQGALSSDLHTSIIPVVKALSKTASAYISSVASSANEEVADFLQLDGNLAPLFEFLAVFTDRMHNQQLHGGIFEQKTLLRWVPFVLLACAHVSCEQLPAAASMKTFTYAEQILTQCELITDTSSRPELLAKYSEQLVALCSQGVSKVQWVDRHSFPKHVLRWVTLQVPPPHLGGDLLGRLLALVFPLIDDLSDESQLVGAQILQHVMHSVTVTELRWYSDVILEVLRVAITSRKLGTIDVLLDCLTTSLDKLSPPGEFAHYDKFFPRLLNDTSLMSDVAMRTLFLRRLRPMIVRMGAPHSIHVIRYLQPLLKVLVASFEGINIQLLLETLETLRVTILSAWPRVPAHTEEIFVGVMRTVAFCEVFDAGSAMLSPVPEQKAEILQRCEHILELLHELSSNGDGEQLRATSGEETQDNKRQESRVVTMLREVGASCSPLQPVCGRMVAKLSHCVW